MVIEFDKISSHSPIWVFQSNKILDSSLISQIEVDVNNFLNNWTSHNLEMKSSYKILHRLFLIISVENNFSNPSGCSIDKLINFIKNINQIYNIDFLNRLNVSFRHENKIKVVELIEFKNLILNGIIDSDTIVFNNMIHTKAELNENWETKVSESWYKKYFNDK
jgi:hypothetical protein|tara:strand:+ start:384 stop:875 length:492 start_codon:yes stop_codon:yes gene_type:complete